jgi:hypothetical protein
MASSPARAEIPPASGSVGPGGVEQVFQVAGVFCVDRSGIGRRYRVAGREARLIADLRPAGRGGIRRRRRNQSAGRGVTLGTIGLSVEEAATMARRQSPAQRKTVERVMHEFKHGELKTGGGASKVKNQKQAVAIALHEAGASKYESPAKNKRNLRHTKAKERRGETYRDEAEGRSGDKTKAQLYAEAKRRDIPGRSKMDKSELQRALHR